ncbi:unnamed protein product, partial [Bubo scandiacus]
CPHNKTLSPTPPSSLKTRAETARGQQLRRGAAAGGSGGGLLPCGGGGGACGPGGGGAGGPGGGGLPPPQLSRAAAAARRPPLRCAPRRSALLLSPLPPPPPPAAADTPAGKEREENERGSRGCLGKGGCGGDGDGAVRQQPQDWKPGLLQAARSAETGNEQPPAPCPALPQAPRLRRNSRQRESFAEPTAILGGGGEGGKGPRPPQGTRESSPSPLHARQRLSNAGINPKSPQEKKKKRARNTKEGATVQGQVGRSLAAWS